MNVLKVIGAIIPVILAIIEIIERIRYNRKGPFTDEEAWELDLKDEYNPSIWEGIDPKKVRYNRSTGLYEPIDPNDDPFID